MTQIVRLVSAVDSPLQYFLSLVNPVEPGSFEIVMVPEFRGLTDRLHMHEDNMHVVLSGNASWRQRANHHTHGNKSLSRKNAASNSVVPILLLKV
jgi:hypothetical protein